MADHSLIMEWQQTSVKDDYWYGRTASRFSAQVGKSTNIGRYVWMIFHEDFRYCVYSGDVGSVNEGQVQAQAWIETYAKTPIA